MIDAVVDNDALAIEDGIGAFAETALGEGQFAESLRLYGSYDNPVQLALVIAASCGNGEGRCLDLYPPAAEIADAPFSSCDDFDEIRESRKIFSLEYRLTGSKDDPLGAHPVKASYGSMLGGGNGHELLALGNTGGENMRIASPMA